MTGQKVLILGPNGRIGSAAARAFCDAGWSVKGLSRRPLENLAGIVWVKGDAGDAAQVRAAAQDADVVVNALNLPYDKWDKGRAEAQLRAVLEGLRGLDVTLMFQGNIYNYGADQTVITPTTEQRPARDKGEIRKRMEDQLRAAASDKLQVLILRAGDFYGPDCTGTFFDLAALARVNAGVLYYPSGLDHGHSWAYLPDLGRAYVAVAERRSTLDRFENFQFRGHFVTGQVLVDLLRAEVGRPVKVKNLPWGVMRAIGIFVPFMRELVKMRYLWDTPHQMQDERLETILGPDFGTPLAKAVARIVPALLEKANSDGKGSGSKDGANGAKGLRQTQVRP